MLETLSHIERMSRVGRVRQGDALGREQWIFINRKSPVNVQQLVVIEAI
jgi:hypothetical protein